MTSTAAETHHVPRSTDDELRRASKVIRDEFVERSKGWRLHLANVAEELEPVPESEMGAPVG